MEGFDLGEELLAVEEKRASRSEMPKTQNKQEAPPVLQAVSLTEFLTISFPPRENLLSPWLPTQGLAMIYGPRGYGKTFTVLGISVAVTSGGNFMRWKAPSPKGVLYIDGEMPGSALQERLSRIIESSDKEPSAPFKIITPDLQERGMPDITTLRGQLSIEQHLDEYSLIVLDNLSCLCRTGKENEAEGWLLRLGFGTQFILGNFRSFRIIFGIGGDRFNMKHIASRYFLNHVCDNFGIADF